MARKLVNSGSLRIALSVGSASSTAAIRSMVLLIWSKKSPSRVSRLVYCSCVIRCSTSVMVRGTAARMGNSSTTTSSRSTVRSPPAASSSALIAGPSGVLENRPPSQ